MWLTFSWSGDLQKEEWIFVRAMRSLSSGASSLRCSSVNSKNTSPFTLFCLTAWTMSSAHPRFSRKSHNSPTVYFFRSSLLTDWVMTQKPWQYLCYVSMSICQPFTIYAQSMLHHRFRTTDFAPRHCACALTQTNCERAGIIWSVTSFQGGDLHLESV